MAIRKIPLSSKDREMMEDFNIRLEKSKTTKEFDEALMDRESLVMRIVGDADSGRATYRDGFIIVDDDMP